jgi:hypothetical protein
LLLKEAKNTKKVQQVLTE